MPLIRRRVLLGGLLAALPGCAAARGEDRIAEPFGLPALPDNRVLRPLGGLEIDRQRLGFGGLSGLHLSPDLTLSAVSDVGHFAEFSLVLDAQWRPMALLLRRKGRLRDGGGRFLQRGYAGDAESLARLPDGDWLVGFERWHRVRRYRDLDGPGLYAEAPPGVSRAPANAGLETLTVLADGRWLAIAEELEVPDRPDATTAWIGGSGGWTTLGYRPDREMVPVDAAALPDGGALVLERGFSLFGGFSGRLVRLPAAAFAAVAPGAVLAGEEILRFASPLPVDNYEGVAMTRHQGRDLVAVVSDDNENRLQRSLVLLFELIG